MTRRHKLRILRHHVAAARTLPRPIARFYLRALVLALRAGDDFSLRSATQPGDLRVLTDIVAGAKVVVELGTATGWGSAALLLSDRERLVTSYDPVVQPHRDRYLALLPEQARRRLTLIQAAGADGAADHAGTVDLLFIDSTHERDATLEEVAAWRPKLKAGGRIAFHDYDNPQFPGVAEAVAQLDLEGEVRGGVFVARIPAR